jgi:hypothetical protein
MPANLRVTSVLAAALALPACGGTKLFRTEQDLAPRSAAPPATSLPATTTRATPIHSSPSAESPAVAELPAGAEVTASESAIRGFRRIKAADGRGGYVQEGALRLTSGPGPQGTNP